MGASGVEALRIYQLAEKVADEVWAEVITWKPFARDTVGREFVRAADSIGANISEGHGRYHYREEINFDFYSRGSLKETRHWLRRANVRGLLSEGRYERILSLLGELEPQLNSYIRSLRRKSASPRADRRGEILTN